MTKAEQIRQAKRRGDVKAVRALRSNIHDKPGDYEAQAVVPETPDNPEMLELDDNGA